MMRTTMTVAIGGIAALCCVLGTTPARAEDQAPTDPTRGQWDSFLDPLRDLEDDLTGQQKALEDSTKVHVGAAIQKGFTYDFGQPKQGTPLPYDGFEYHDSPSIDAAQLRLSRPSDGWYIPGFGLTLSFGKLARRIKSDWNGDGGVNRGDTFETNNFDAEEAYLNWTVPDDSPALKGLTVKGGKFVTLLGAEVLEPWLNYNNSRSLLFTFAIPVTNTGVLLSYPVTDKITITGGPVAGWDQVASNNNGWTGMGGVSWTATDQWSFATNGIWGPSQNNNTGNKRGVIDLIATYKPTDALTFNANYDWGHEEHASLTSGGAALWQGFSLIANYAFTDRLSSALRGEWFEDPQGARTGTPHNTVYEGTWDVKYLITQHLYTQAELRFDKSDHDVFLADSNTDFKGNHALIGANFTYVFN
jgi:putative OmpL-like beta-barrel porin-2